MFHIGPKYFIKFFDTFQFSAHVKRVSASRTQDFFRLLKKNIRKSLSATTSNDMHHLIEVQGGPSIVISELLNVTVVHPN